MVAGGTVLTQALLLAAGAVGARIAVLLAAPALVPRGADARPRDGVTQRPILTLAPVAAVRAPVDAVTC